jgi:ABC-type polysaccharide/polyol phosphate export permease
MDSTLALPGRLSCFLITDLKIFLLVRGASQLFSIASEDIVLHAGLCNSPHGVYATTVNRTTNSITGRASVCQIMTVTRKHITVSKTAFAMRA